MIRTVISAFHASKTHALSTEQCSVFIQYALTEMERHPDDIITLLMKFLENNANIRRMSFVMIFEYLFQIDLLFDYFITFLPYI